MTASMKTLKESDLCEAFIRDFNQLDGWTCYPESAGFDVLVVHDDGRQIGVEAKLQLNAKVADQILPSDSDAFYGAPGPDHRLVIVAKITDASAGIAKMLHRLGVSVMACTASSGGQLSFPIQNELFQAERGFTRFGAVHLFDWNPAERCRVPVMVAAVPAGVPAPKRLTPWKEAALRVVALMRRQGYITVKQIAEQGIGVSSWTQWNGSKPPWLAKGAARGQWVETEHMPPFDKQHPDVYELTMQQLTAIAQH